MDFYQEKLAPIFSQIILQKEFEQSQILSEACERFKSQPYALSTQKCDYSRFDRAAKELVELWNAHKRIKDKSYGRCSACGDSIDLLRLNAYPTTLHCLSCNYKRDRQARRATHSYA